MSHMRMHILPELSIKKIGVHICQSQESINSETSNIRLQYRI
jgi:hypothetical protein